MREPVWVLPAVAIVLHGRLLAEHGGAEGLRDPGLLEAALARPRQILAYGKPDHRDLAAAYVSGLVRDHPFIDGNKRLGFMLAYVFLRSNGYRLVAGEADAAAMTLGLAAGSVLERDYADWMRRNVEAVKRGG